mgnify:CR=1 FL=1
MKNNETRYCKYCNEPIESTKRNDSKFCNESCKSEFHNKDKRENYKHNKYIIFNENGTLNKVDIIISNPKPYDKKIQNGRKVVRMEPALKATQEKQTSKPPSNLIMGGFSVFLGAISILVLKKRIKI